MKWWSTMILMFLKYSSISYSYTWHPALLFSLFLYMYIQERTEKFKWQHHICSGWLFWSVGLKHCNTNGRTMWTTSRTMLKNQPHFVTFYNSIWVNLLTLQLTLILTSYKTNIKWDIKFFLVLYIYIYIYTYNQNEAKMRWYINF